MTRAITLALLAALSGCVGKSTHRTRGYDDGIVTHKPVVDGPVSQADYEATR